MAVLNISEFRGPAIQSGVMTPAYRVPPIATQKVTFTTSTQSTVFNSATTLVRLLSDTTCYINFGTNPTAITTTDIKLMADQVMDVWLDVAGMKVAAVT